MEQELFYGTSGPIDGTARIAIVGEAWGTAEAAAQRPFVGPSGDLLNRLLAGAGVARDECFVTNLVAAQPENNDFTHFLRPGKGLAGGGVNPGDALTLGLARLYRQLEVINPTIIITCGNWPLWALVPTCVDCKSVKGFYVPSGIAKWRGSQLTASTDRRLVPIYHPAAILRQYELFYVTQSDVKRAIDQSSAFAWKRTVECRVAVTPWELVDWLPSGGPLVVDIETVQGQVDVVGLAKSSTEALVTTFGHGNRPAGAELDMREALHFVLQNRKFLLIGQNFIYDAQWLARDFLFTPRCYRDTMLMHHCLWPGTPKALNYIASLYCTPYAFWKEEGRQWQAGDDVASRLQYNALDTTYTYECWCELDRLTARMGMQSQVAERHESWQLAIDMTLRGVRIDAGARNKLITLALNLQRDYADRLRYLIPPDPNEKVVWYRSPAQQRAIFYDKMGIQPVINRKTGQPTLSDDVFPTLAKREPLLQPIFELLTMYRSVSVELQTMLMAPLDDDGRARSSYDPAGTETFRWSSRKNAFGRGLNLQNISKPNEEYTIALETEAEPSSGGPSEVQEEA